MGLWGYKKQLKIWCYKNIILTINSSITQSMHKHAITCCYTICADDSAIFYAHKDPRVIFSKLGSVLDKCSTWLVNNKLSLHLGKTECSLFGSKRKLSDFKDFSIVWNNHVIKSADHVKYLGVIIDNSLSRDYIVDSIVQKVNSRLKFLYRQARFLDLIDMCLWNTDAPGGNKVEIWQNL